MNSFIQETTVPKTPMIPERVVHCKTPNKLEQLPIEEPEPMISYVEVQPASRPDNLAVTDIEEESTQRSPEQQEIGNSISVQPIAAASEDDSTRMAKPFKLDTNDPKIIAALEEIKNCDYILETKFQLLKNLARQRKEMESINGTHIKLDKEIEKELKSKRKDVLTMLSRSQNFDHVNDATFLTEATFEKELSTGLASDQSDSKNHQEYKSNGSRTTPSMPKNFKKGDFIQRNIVLGADARFFSAMSEDEEKRVERVLEIDFDDASYSCSIGSPETRPVSVLSGFTPEPEDLEKLNSIHSRLQQIIPPLEWDSKSTALSTHEHSVGSQTPRSSVWSTSSDLHSVDWHKEVERVTASGDIELKRIIHDESKRLKQLEKELGKLRLQAEDVQIKPIQRDLLDRLIFESIKNEASLMSSKYGDGSVNWEDQSTTTTLESFMSMESKALNAL